jgi:transcriptional regulator with XRE-family HTH domain
MHAVNPQLCEQLRRWRERRGLTQRGLAKLVACSHVHLNQIERGGNVPSSELVARLDKVLNTGGALSRIPIFLQVGDHPDEVEAVELAARVAATDVSDQTLTQLEAAFDSLAMRYATTPPGELLPLVRHHLGHVPRLLEGRATLAQQRRLLVVGGWLSALAATLHIDLRNQPAATARLHTADQLARHADHDEIRGWCLETRAWDLLTTGDYRTALEVAQQAERVAPRGSSAHIQAVAQQGRAHARVGDRRSTHRCLDRLEKLVAGIVPPDQPEHHYRYDPAKADAYRATTLAWAADPAAEPHVRQVITLLQREGGRPRRIASAHLDLALALLAAGEVEEAQHATLRAVASGRVAASNWWRVEEIVAGLGRVGAPMSPDLREAYRRFAPRRSVNTL